MVSTGMIPLVALPQEPLDSGTRFVNSELILEMIEGLVLEVEGVDRGDMQIPLPPYAIVVGLANAGLVLEKAWPAMNDRFGHGRSIVSSVLVPTMEVGGQE